MVRNIEGTPSLTYLGPSHLAKSGLHTEALAVCFVRPMGKERSEKMVSEHGLSSNALLTIVVGNVQDDAEVHFEAEWIMHKARGRAIRNMHAQYSFVTHKKAGGTA